MFPWILVCAALTAAFVLGLKIIFLYKDLKEISRQFQDRLQEDTNNVIYVPGNDRRLKAFAEQLNRELAILYDRRRRYQSGDRELKEAVTNISHDLRTPLTAIYGYLELLEMELMPPCHGVECEQGLQVTKNVVYMKQLLHYAAQIRNRADAMRALTEELFRYSIIVAEQEMEESKDGKKEEVVLNRILADSLLSYYDIFRKNQIEPQIRIPDEEVVRCLDEGALKRIFANILDNAVKYCKPADNTACGQFGAVSNRTSVFKTITVELSTDGTITFCNRAENLDKVSVERLFDRFYTVETGRNATGLGLSIAKLLVERMGGSIQAAYVDGMLEIVVKI